MNCHYCSANGVPLKETDSEKKISKPVYVQMASTFRNKRQLDMCAID